MGRIRKRSIRASAVFGRIALCAGTFILFVAAFVYAAGFVVAHGPSKTVRDSLVLSALQASATKWAPSLYFPQKTVDEIVAASEVETIKEIKPDDYVGETDAGEWDNAVDGMLFTTYSGNTFKAYVLVIKDPSRVFVGPTYDYSQSSQGRTVFEAVEAENALACINGGEFSDIGGVGSGSQPLGTTFSKGKAVWNDGHTSGTFIGFDKNDKMIVCEGMTVAKGNSLNVRDGVMFKSGNVLIDSSNDSVRFHYTDKNTGVAQRTAIGQRADGAVIFAVTDGRSASSLGATRNDMIDLMKSYGAVSAGYLDGGSSSVMYYESWYEKYPEHAKALDDYQKLGLVNHYKAFSSPRHIPTFFLVAREEAAQ